MYVKSHVGLSPAQARNLYKGKSVNVKYNAQGTGVHLTKTQHKKLMDACKKGKGLRLSMSKSQVKKHMKEGGSVWSFLKKAAKAVGRVIKPYIKPALVGLATSKGGPLAGKAAEYGLTKLGLGRKRRVGRPKGGRGGLYPSGRGGLFP